MARVCRVWSIARSTMYYQKQQDALNPPKQKRGRKPCYSDDALLMAIRSILDERFALGFHGEGYRKVWAKLRFQGIPADKERVRRIMGENNLLAPHRQGSCLGPRHHDGTIIPMAPNIMWGTDATTTHTLAQGTATVFAAVDHFTGECVGIHASLRGNRFEALEPIMQGISVHYGPYHEGCAQGLMIRHDHGSQYMSQYFQKELRFIGAESSPSFVRSPEGNGVIERFFRTLKEQLLWIQQYQSVEERVQALHAFKDQYNQHWMMQRHGYKTPQQVRDQWKADIMEAA